MPFRTLGLLTAIQSNPTDPNENLNNNIELVGTGSTQCVVIKNDAGVVLEKICPLGVEC